MTADTKYISTDWYPELSLLATRLSGEINSADIDRWKQSLLEKLSMVEDNSRFKILVNLYGFQAADLPTHKKYRTIIPELLAGYGWKVGYVNLFEEAASMQLTYTRGIRCVAAAHVHQDETKIEKYESLFGKENEHFFTNPIAADAWIRTIQV
jgi:hypothetical protein